MVNNNKELRALCPELEAPKSLSNDIIANKTYSIKELSKIFSKQALMFVKSKEELLKYEYLAIEIGVKEFRDNIDYVYNRKYAV